MYEASERDIIMNYVSQALGVAMWKFHISLCSAAYREVEEVKKQFAVCPKMLKKRLLLVSILSFVQLIDWFGGIPLCLNDNLL